jgi:fumarate hydratase subunit alpha
VAELCREANVILPRDVKEALEAAEKRETSASGHFALQQILANADYAERSGLALCQDGGITTVFLDIGQEVVWEGGFLEDAVNDGVREGYQSSYLRGSVLDRPFNGRNTGDNTPAVIHTRIVPGDAVTVTVLPKGGGADNASQLRILTPAQGLSGVHEFVLDTVKAAGPGACPPLIVGVGIGGSFDSVGLLARRALLRDIGTRHPDPDVAKWEKAWLRDINSLGIGPQGYGGLVTALAVHIVTAPRHIASIPVAVNLQCHSARKGVRVL